MTFPLPFSINGREINQAVPPYVIAELSANHGGSLETALRTVDAAAEAGAAAIKLQHYKPNSITVRSPLPEFRVSGGTLWDDQQLIDLYEKAMTPWEWTRPIIERAAEKGLHCFSSPFDKDAVDFLEEQGVVAYKVASFELVDLPLIRYIAQTGKPMIMSTGMATVEEIDAAVEAARGAGAQQVALLRCNSGYPADPAEMDLSAIPYMKSRWNCEIGLSDHTMSSIAAIAAIALGATIFEKHIILDRGAGGPDSEFSVEPDEMRGLISDLNIAWSAMGSARFGPSKRETASIAFRRSLRSHVKIRRNDVVSESNVRSMRPGGGLPPDDFSKIVGRRVTRDLEIGAAITWDVIE